MPSQNPAQEFSADAPNAAGAALREDTIEYGFIGKLQGLKYTYRRDISDRASLENNFRENKAIMDAVLPEENLRGFKGQYLETAKKLKEQQGKTGGKDDTTDDPVDQIDFEFVLFASAVIDYDYIMSLIACYSAKVPGKSKMTREELIGLISADAKFIHERDDIATCLSSLDSLITAETQQLEALKTHKRGLIQQFFPAPTEQPHTIEGHHPGFPSPEEAEA